MKWLIQSYKHPVMRNDSRLLLREGSWSNGLTFMFRTFTSLSSTWTASLPPSAPSLRTEPRSDACGTFLTDSGWSNAEDENWLRILLFCGARTRVSNKTGSVLEHTPPRPQPLSRTRLMQRAQNWRQSRTAGTHRSEDVSAARVPSALLGWGLPLTGFTAPEPQKWHDPKPKTFMSQRTGELETLRGRGNGSSMAT